MNEKKRLIKNTGIIAVGNISTKLVSFFLLPLYTNILSTAEYGTVDYIISIATFCVPFISLLMDESMFRFLIDCETKKEKEKIVTNSLCIILLGGSLFSIVSIPILSIVRYQYTIYFVVYILSVVLSTMISALLRGIGRTDQYAIYNFLITTIQIILNVVFLAVLYLGVIGMLLAAIVSQIVVSIIYIIKFKMWRYIVKRYISLDVVKDMLIYSVPLIPNKLSWSIINLSDRIIIMNFLGSSFSGLYAIAYKFPNLMDTVYGFFYQSWKESSARVVGNDSKDDFYNFIYDNLKRFMYSIVLGMIAFMPVVFKILINPSYSYAINYVPILLLATYFANISGFYGGIFTAYKDTKIMGTTTIAAAIINLVVNILLIYKIGLYAAAFSTLISNLVVYIYRKIKVEKYVILKEYITDRIISWIVTIVILICFYLNENILIVLACIISMVYAIIHNRFVFNVFFRKLVPKK